MILCALFPITSALWLLVRGSRRQTGGETHQGITERRWAEIHCPAMPPRPLAPEGAHDNPRYMLGVPGGNSRDFCWMSVAGVVHGLPEV